MNPLLGCILVLTVLFLSHLTWKQWKRINRQRFLLKKYYPIINIDETVEERSIEKDKLVKQITELESAYKSLKKEHNIYQDDLEMITYGHYTPRYDFKDTKLYKYKLDAIRGEQKKLIKNKEAIVSIAKWEVEGSRAKGRIMMNRTIKLALNAFNVQADNTILKVTFKNINSSKERLEKIKDNINKLLEPNHCHITDDFFQLKIQELYLAYEYEEKLQEEKEEQRRIKQQMREEKREEEKVKKEIARAEAEAKRDEEMFQKALETARIEAAAASAEQKSKYELRIKALKEQLIEVQQKKERALSMAQQTRCGHVYIISNIGSFGEEVYKIGVTRRLEPEERVKELGDASVPFEFDIHAMIRSKNAPELEKKLHESFNKFRVNRINTRKEFFKMKLNQIEHKCTELGVNVEFTKLAQAKEYRETLAITNREKPNSHEIKNNILDEVTEALKKAA